MKTMIKYTAAALIVLGVSLSLHAKSISGQWRADIETPNGLHKVLFTFQVDGAKLTGTALDNVNGRQRQGQLTEGTYTNGQIFFVTYHEADTGDTLRIEYHGTPGTNGIHFLAQVADVTTLDFVATPVELANAAIPAADFSGTWTWSTPGRNGGPDRTSTLTLTEDHGKLTGKVSAPGRDGASVDTPIANGKVDGGKISFDLVREINGNKITINYTGEVGADKITGKTSFNRNGEAQSRDWLAKRVGAGK